MSGNDNDSLLSAERQGPRNASIDIETGSSDVELDGDSRTSQDVAIQDAEYGTCRICYEDSELKEICRKQHRLCLPCIATYCLHYLEEHRRAPIQCPDCQNDVSKHLIMAVLGDHPAFRSYERMERKAERLAEDPSLVECPHCDELVEDPYDKEDANARLCASCGTTFCKVHGESHRGMSCPEFEQTLQAKNLRETEATLAKYTKPCSRCGARIQRSRGCDHVWCSACRQDMCWRCGTHEHLQGSGRKFHCSACKQKFADHRVENTCGYGCRTYSAVVMFMILLIVWPPVMLAVCLLSFGYCFCCGCGRCGNARHRVTQRRLGALRMGCIITTFPILVVLSEFGVRMPVLEDLEGGQSDEIPVMDVVEDHPL